MLGKKKHRDMRCEQRPNVTCTRYEELGLFIHCGTFFLFINTVIKILMILLTPKCFLLLSSMAVSHLEPELQEKLKSLPTPVEWIYFNKGL